MNKYNNTYYNTIKMKPADNENNTYIDFGKKKLLINALNLKLVIMLEYHNTEIFLETAILQIDLRKFL